jgi:hypothetical protein
MDYIIVSRVHAKKKMQFGAILFPARINIIPAKFNKLSTLVHLNLV